ncbi:hypothetical protein QTP70_030741 [Hemibagrus guttatus]|uniref:Protein SPT2 homolog n=1 Tax=Hemibagrus guttatus TaxID=175788 RepID=A0AAE0UZW0_9TELE|nr:hypothetical protein QTP70_030741 [Hemibagrus guttatus]
MDFNSVLSIASQKQGLSSLPKRYSLKPGPPKKDPKVKGVNSAAVQAFLKKQEVQQKKKVLEQKKQKEVLLAKRVELKSDRKARAMASRTKDNFHGYNGIPILDKPKKRQSRGEKYDQQSDDDAYFDEDNCEYANSDSESEPEPTPAVRPQERSNGSTKMNNTQKKPSVPPKAAPPPMNFADLLKLAEKKQFEPVELKPTKKTEERLRTAEEIRELELERKAKKQDKGRDIKPDKISGHKDSKSSTNSHKKNMVDKEGTSHRSSSEKSSRKGEVPRAGGNPPPRPGINGPMRSAPPGSSKKAETPHQPRPGGSVQGRPVPGGSKPSLNGQGRSSRPLNTIGPGPGRPPCTVVSETISSKNFAPKQGMAARPPVPQGPTTVIGPTGPVLPPITSSYKRKFEDEEEFDSEMEDFIDDEGEDQDEISKHIREIFGYDRSKYKDESDYALKFMESSWKEQQKEEARSLRLGIKEDEEDMRMEEEEIKRKQVMKAKRKKT